MATPAEIRVKAAWKLGIKGEGQALRAEHSADLDKAYLEVHDELEHDRLIYWSGTSESIPDAYVNPLVAMVAARRATEYGVSQARYERIKLEEREAWKDVWKLSQTHKMSKTEIEYF